MGAAQADNRAAPEKVPTEVKNWRRDKGRPLVVIDIDFPFFVV